MCVCVGRVQGSGQTFGQEKGSFEGLRRSWWLLFERTLDYTFQFEGIGTSDTGATFQFLSSF